MRPQGQGHRRQEEVADADISRRGAAALAAALCVVCVYAVADRGAFDPTGQILFAGLAGVALFVAAMVDERIGRAAREPVVLVLAAIGVVCLLSAAWTVAEAGAAIRWGAVVLAYAAVVAAAASLARAPRGRAVLAALVAGLALAAGLAGLAAVAFQDLPWAERITATWRPGGPLEYPPALALLQVSALPVALAAMVRARPRVAVPAALVAACAGAVLGLAHSRLHMALAAAVLAVAVIAPRPTVHGSRAAALAAAAVVAAAAIAAHVLLGGRAEAGATGDDAGRVAALAALLAVAVGAWAALRGRIDGRAPSPPLRGPALAAACVVALAAGAWAVAGLSGAPERARPSAAGSQAQAEPSARKRVRPPRGTGRDAGIDRFTHGRIRLWEVTIDVAADRPLLGAGALAFGPVTRAGQGRRATRFAHNLPLELWLELGLLGAALAVALYVAAGRLLLRARRAPSALWAFGPATVAFLVANLLDWPWHQPGATAVSALALGGLAGAAATRSGRPAPRPARA